MNNELCPIRELECSIKVEKNMEPIVEWQWRSDETRNLFKHIMNSHTVSISDDLIILSSGHVVDCHKWTDYVRQVPKRDRYSELENIIKYIGGSGEEKVKKEIEKLREQDKVEKEQ